MAFSRGWILGFALARQVHYHLSYNSSPFCFGYFEVRSHFLPRLTWTTVLFMFPTVAGMMTGTYHHAHLFSFEMGVLWTFAWAGLEPWSSQSQPPM
jgi:hypothetical protein